MSGLAAEIDAPVVVARAVHFAAVATTTGALIFRAAVADPALASEKKARLVVDRRIRRVAWIGLVLTLISGGAWLLLQGAAMSGQSYREVMTSGALLTVIDETQFGLVARIRLGLAVMLAICLAFESRPLPRWFALAAALCLIAAIAWTGHAASTPFTLGYVHLTADALHLAAAAVWTGGLVSLALLLHAISNGVAPVSSEVDAVRRFSVIGVVSVAILAGSGAVNAWILVGSLHGLLVTQYGWVLMTKLAAVAIMLALAAINRFWLTPRIASPESDVALRYLTRNTMAEIGLALFVYAVVGVLGTLHPAAHLVE
jgi:putative copper resistance protein D